MLERLRAGLRAAGLAAVLTASPRLAQYLAGTYNPIRTLIPDRPVLVLVPVDGAPVLFAHVIERTLLEREGRTAVYYDGGPAALAAVCADTLGGLAPVGVELESVPAPFLAAARDRLPPLADAGEILARAVAVKSARQVRAIAAAALATDRAQWAAFRSFRVGATEHELGRALRQALITEGAENIAFLTLGSGPRSLALHERPSARVPAPGELLRVDLGGVFEGWCSDLAKTAAIAEPGPQRRAMYRTLRELLDRHIDRLRAGRAARDAYAAVAADFATQGLRLDAGHVGHGLGLGTHEWPVIEPASDATFEPGMVLSAELVHADRGERFHLEETVLVTEGGPEVLSRSQPGSERELPALGKAFPS
jgi:Xaa-Pro aminopeptidase